MNTIVDFTTAQLLKEKGIHIETLKGYYTHGDTQLLLWVGSEHWNNQEDFLGYAPTIAEVVMWLYEKHDIWITCETSRLGKFNYRLSKKESSKLITLPFTFEVLNAGYDFNSPKEAYSQAIEFTLKNLI